MMSNELPVAFPLQWPVGWRRATPVERRNARFRTEQKSIALPNGQWREQYVTVKVGIDRVLVELSRLNVSDDEVVISSNMPVKLNGLPRSGAREPDDPGVAVYWRLRVGRQTQSRCMAVDAYTRVGDNLAAIAATLAAIRLIQRHGGAQILDRVFQGFIALPAPEQWFQVLGVSSHATREEIEAAHARLAMAHHPDRGGDGAVMARINIARDDGLGRLS